VVDVQPTSDGLRVSVEDDGPGITAADPSRLFEPFIRGEGGGYGLGLALVRAATEAHGGAAWIETGASGGCRVVTRWGG
jgi:signal transduction histidine kinase